MTIQIDQFTCRTDNFGVLMHDSESGETALIDAPEEATILAAIERTGWTPTVILTTHHHTDHIEANLSLKQKFNLKIIGPKAEAAKIPGIDEEVAGGDVFTFGGEEVRVIDTPGHTAGHVSYYLPNAGIAFTADTLFALGCGRLFEAPAPVMYESLKKLAALPPETKVYCGHEYTLSNARFSVTVDPDNAALKARLAAVEKARAAGKPTVPSTLGEEKTTNPFLRADDPAVAAAIGMKGADPAEVFTEIRERKNTFKG